MDQITPQRYWKSAKCWVDQNKYKIIGTAWYYLINDIKNYASTISTDKNYQNTLLIKVNKNYLIRLSTNQKLKKKIKRLATNQKKLK